MAEQKNRLGFCEDTARFQSSLPHGISSGEGIRNTDADGENDEASHPKSLKGLRLRLLTTGILCRAFQGIGGAGIFSMVPIIVAEMVEPIKYGAYNGIISLAIAFSFLLGPLLGGIISDGTTWRWIFWINLPIGVTGLLLVLVSLGFTKRNVDLRGRIDYPGFFILLAASVLLIVAIEEAGISFAWSSALVIAFLVVAGVFLLLFLFWQWYLYHIKSAREPILPWSFLKNRILMGLYL
ncbi:hypothetical protein N7468_000011 [Penicillium chermesinum]|uniref:Major facilitator superfamily (MFS) profile domain-containing protein n=1 Tax=Penicillium chermesinum TaxID=63820 RepID=A0A9W9PLJ9_9EURO|nr:uncharacterized protein N7468_000011 [Penicillium chermesinum]KAJ5248560.1 hypothetical protein N7468_000011 [Penicillium chermesinum]